MSLTNSSTLRTLKAYGMTPQAAEGVSPVTHSYSTPSQLLAAIEAAEHVLFACGTLVEMAEHDLDNARLAQRVSRDRVMELRQQLIQMEAGQ